MKRAAIPNARVGDRWPGWGFCVLSGLRQGLALNMDPPSSVFQECWDHRHALPHPVFKVHKTAFHSLKHITHARACTHTQNKNVSIFKYTRTNDVTNLKFPEINWFANWVFNKCLTNHKCDVTCPEEKRDSQGWLQVRYCAPPPLCPSTLSSVLRNLCSLTTASLGVKKLA